MKTTMEQIGPAQAAEILKGNWGNRQIRKAVVSALADEMKAGRWLASHQGVAISATGRLLDGQHRLEAVRASGVTVTMMVTRGVHDDVFNVTDIGERRSLRDIMRIDGRIIDSCNWIARLHGAGKIRTHHVEAVLAHCGEPLSAMTTVAGRVARGRTTAPIKAAVCLRILQGHRAYALEQWAALVHLEYSSMSPAVQALCKQIADDHSGTSSRRVSSFQFDRAARTWIAFDPDRSALRKIQITNLEVPVSQMRAVFQPWEPA